MEQGLGRAYYVAIVFNVAVHFQRVQKRTMQVFVI